ncbi:MAG TPA: GGDEF domain-containing protein [Treponemataceae bacterium]|nr:GGDEF domain-containing protein [Treponemataceae bacterium]
MKTTLRLGLQINAIDADYSRDLITGISNWCSEHDMSFILFSGRAFGWPYGYEYQNTAVYSHIHPGSIDALILITGTQCNFIPKEAFQEYLTSLAPLPVISVSVALDGIPSIVVDNETGLRNLVSHLIEVHGVQKIAVFKGPDDNPEAVLRLSVFLKTLEEHGIPFDASRVINGDFSIENCHTALAEYCSRHPVDFDALVCLNDNMAIGAVKYFQEQGIRVPEDLLVTGFDDLVRSRYEEPSMSTVSQNLVEQGRLAAEYATRVIQGKQVPSRTTLATRAVFRQSCGCVPRGNLEYTAIMEDNQKQYASPEFFINPSASWFRLQDGMYKLRQYLFRLVSLLSLSDLIEELRVNFESFDIQTCAIVLFRKAPRNSRGERFALPAEAEIILHYDEETRGNADRNPLFFDPRKELLPAGIFSDRPRMLIVNALYHREHQLGYIVFEQGMYDAALYETLCVQLSTSIRAALVFEEKEAAEERLNEALFDLERSNKKLNDISRTDELTGLYNRRGFISLGQRSIDLALRRNKNGLIMFGDMDGLKLINDTWGHETGDRAIVAMANVLKKTFRNMDVLARLGGDEFSVVAVDINPGFLETIRSRIEDYLAEYNETSGEPFTLSISIGAVAFSGSENNRLEKLLSVADSLLYEEKRLKRESRRKAKGHKPKS